MRVRTIFCVLLIAVMSIACNKKNDETPNVLGGIGIHVVNHIEAYVGTPGSGEFDSAILLSYDSDLRLTDIAYLYYDDGEEILDPKISIKYGNGTATIDYLYDGETGSIECTLNSYGAITRAVYGSEADGMVEEYTYNKANELQKYTARIGDMETMTLNYEWKNGNIYRVTSDMVDETYAFTYEYTTEGNIYNIDIFHGCTFLYPYLCELITVNTGLFGKKNHGFLKTIAMGDEQMPIFDYEFKSNGELKHIATDGAYLVFNYDKE